MSPGGIHGAQYRSTTLAHCSSSEYPMPIDSATDEGDVPVKSRTSSSKKRLSQGYIPRPQNAFMLFRADFIKTRHIPGSAETSNQSLSKYIGELIFTYEMAWKALTTEEKNEWEVKAKHEKAAHKLKYPEYRFRPVHTKHKRAHAAASHSALLSAAKARAKRSQARGTEGEQRWEEVTRLLLEGKKGEELLSAIEELDRGAPREAPLNVKLHVQGRPFASAPASRDCTPPHFDLQQPSPSSWPTTRTTAAPRHRRSSSAPQPSLLNHSMPRPIALPTLSPVVSRPASPSIIPSISRFRQSPSQAVHFAEQSRRLQYSMGLPGHFESQYPSITHVDAAGYCPQTLSQAYPGVQGADQAPLEIDHHRRVVSSQFQNRVSMPQRSMTSPAIMTDSFPCMMGVDGIQSGSALPDVTHSFFGNFSFDEQCQIPGSSPSMVSNNTHEYPPIPFNDTFYEQAFETGTINPASLMRNPASSSPNSRLSPIDTSVHSIHCSSISSCSPEPSSATTSDSMLPSPAPSSLSLGSSSDDFDDCDIDFTALLDVNCMALGDLYQDGHTISSESDSFHIHGTFQMPMEGEAMFNCGLGADSPAISSLSLHEEAALYSKMMDMPTPTQATFGMDTS
ncbi:hypothetical protein CVT26_000497 [Gymnopilus dilepis]|uniref:HMG box domain-containing protein n=1 Tax=Gymnopilus dilepis TaxID=231916 RepID=A0A409VH28_9AGAR|nr:hypothetical protein CVT26_000497 [Gymnopilus dilepis]